MLESQSNRAAWFARAATGQLHEAAVSHLLKPRFRDLANNRSSEIAPVPTEKMKIANSAKLIGSRLVTIALYLGTIALAYGLSRRSYGRFSAVIIAFAFATSAGFVTYAHFLTADTPLLFWMLARAFGA
jgi:dolichyl-phosphate-mannose--protein O-mannosyl transferase